MDNITQGVLIVVCAVLLILGLVFGLPLYNVWLQGQKGRAKLAEAEQSKRILIETAKAEVEAAKYKSDAEVERARGVAKANEIIGESLKDNQNYLRYLWIQNLTDGSTGNQVIYVPTEAGLPILEAGRFNNKIDVTNEIGHNTF
jgi:regulator of protease activity HflC (stomatin/prohibitin superfamily)